MSWLHIGFGVQDNGDVSFVLAQAVLMGLNLAELDLGVTSTSECCP